VRINTKYNVIYVKGQNIPGPPRSYVRILDTMIPNKRKLLDNNPPPMPTCYPEDMVEETPENIYHESLFDFNNDTVTYEGVDIDNLFLGHEKQYRLYGGCHDGKNHSYRKGNSAHWNYIYTHTHTHNTLSETRRRDSWSVEPMIYLV